MPRTKTPPSPVDFDKLLSAEFSYIADTANQANEDRARVSSFYLVAVGSLVAALFGTQFFESRSAEQLLTINRMFSVLFFLLTVLGGSTILQLARLRGAWYESMLAMNNIKKFMIDQNPAMREAFLWTSDSLPRKYKRNSVSYYQAVEVALIGGLTFGAFVFFLQQTLPATTVTTFDWVISVVAGGLMTLLQLQVYKRVLQ